MCGDRAGGLEAADTAPLIQRLTQILIFLAVPGRMMEATASPKEALLLATSNTHVFLQLCHVSPLLALCHSHFCHR